MGVLDFLFEGSPPPSTTTYGTTVENMPQWLSDYTQALIARANTVAAEPYQAYQGPRVAGFTDDQTNAFDVIRNNIGNWNDEFDSSKGATSGALSQAMPYFSAAAQSTPQNINQYMNPYVGNVIDRARLEANRTWDEDVMPDIRNRFVGSGQSGSSGHREALERAGRGVAEGINSQSLAALSDAYQTAGAQFGQDASRYAGIGREVGQMGLQTGQQLSGLASLQQQMAGRDAASLQMVGDTRQQQNQRNLDLAYGDFQNQRDYPRENVDWMSSIIRGMPHDRTSSTTSTGPANVYQPSPMSQLISLYGLYKDVTDKARGGVVSKHGGSRPTDSLGPKLVAHYNKKKKEIEASKKLAQGGIVHLPAPMSSLYGRYAEGGKVSQADKNDALRILREMSDKIGGPSRRLGYRNVPEFVDTPTGPWHTGEVKRPPLEGRLPGERRGKFVKRGFHDSKGSDTRYARGGLACLEY